MGAKLTFWDKADKPLGAAVALLTIVGAIATLLYKIRKKFVARLTVERITRSDDRYLEEIWRIHQSKFTDAVADEYTDLQRWLDEAAEARKSGHQRFDEFLLYVKADKQVLGYLFAQYYIQRQLIFLSYIAVDKGALKARRPESEVVIKLFRELIKLIEERGCWRAIVGEFESQKIGRFCSHAQTLMVAFQRSLRKLRQSFDPKADLFHICMNYRQPVLRPDEIDTAVIDGSYDQWLVLLPRHPAQMIRTDENGKSFIDRAAALDILRFVYFEVYLDAFKNDKTYSKYLDAEFAKAAQSLPAQIEVKYNWRAHEENERDRAKEALNLANLAGFKAANHSMPC
jgi:hypothetical protein